MNYVLSARHYAALHAVADGPAACLKLATEMGRDWYYALGELAARGLATFSPVSEPKLTPEGYFVLDHNRADIPRGED